jgi:hypothetical protein
MSPPQVNKNLVKAILFARVREREGLAEQASCATSVVVLLYLHFNCTFGRKKN